MKTIILTASLFVLFSSACKGKDDPSEIGVGSILSIDNIKDTRSSSQTTEFTFYVTVSPVSSKEITVQYKTNDGT
ncbi:MAG TPA: hypothetical protein VIK29_00765, partial [Paludibacter sp.]